MTARTYSIEDRLAHDGSQRGFSCRTYMRFVLHTAGDGHWCVGGAEAGTFDHRAAAEAAGRLWVETGLPPCEQTQERIDRIRRDRQLLETAYYGRADAKALIEQAQPTAIREAVDSNRSIAA